MLTRLGHAVHAFPNGEAALAALSSLQPTPELLITDVVMPGMNGRVLSERVAAALPKIRALFTSGYPQNVIVNQGVLHDGIEILAKPYSVEQLAHRIAQLVDKGVTPTQEVHRTEELNEPRPQRRGAGFRRALAQRRSVCSAVAATATHRPGDNRAEPEGDGFPSVVSLAGAANTAVCPGRRGSFVPRYPGASKGCAGSGATAFSPGGAFGAHFRSLSTDGFLVTAPRPACR